MSYVKTAAIVLIIAMIFSVVLTYASVMTIVQTSKSNTERVLNSFVIQNTTLIYDSIKNGNTFIAAIDTNSFITQFSSDCTLDYEGGYFYNRNSEGSTIFRMTSPQTTFTVNNTLSLTCVFDILYPINFAGKQVSEIRIPIIVKTSYSLKN